MFLIKFKRVFKSDIVTARFVGGCVRKYLSNEKIDDIDIATILSTDEIKENLKIQILKLLKLVLNTEQ